MPSLTTGIENKKLNVAIIGSGISGSSAAYFLKQELGDQVDITIFEKSDYAGGRIQHFEFQGQKVEIGGSLLLNENRVITELVDKFGLTKDPFWTKPQHGYAAIWNSETLNCAGCETNYWKKFINKWRFGNKDYNAFRKYSEGFSANMTTMYNYLETHDGVEHPRDIFAAGGFPKTIYENPFSDVLEDVCKKSCSSSDYRNSAYVNGIIGGVIRCNYGQGFEVNGFLGSVQVVALNSNISAGYNILEGNRAISLECRERSMAKVELLTNITSINTHTCDGTLELTMGKDETRIFDKVILASPLALAKINLNGRMLQPDYRMVFQHVHFIHARLNDVYFKKSKKYLNQIETILISEDSTIDRDIHNVGKFAVDKTNSSLALYKIFTKKLLSEDFLNSVFADIQDIKIFDFFTFPYYDAPVHDFKSFTLEKNLYYTNTLERVASSFEFDAIAARNVAKLVAKSAESQPDVCEGNYHGK